jgi:hypothetical protein
MHWTLEPNLALNGICPYFTMFPLEFPLRILKERARKTDKVLDPFCGRGTTNFAARITGLVSLGVDSSPVAAAITAAKLVSPHPNAVLREARRILVSQRPSSVPTSEFWHEAFHPDVLVSLCQFRQAFNENCETAARIALRGIILGALHGPKQRTVKSYFSNQCPRSYSPKPAYALRFWRKHKLKPERLDVIDLIKRKADRFYDGQLPSGKGYVKLADSRKSGSLLAKQVNGSFQWVISSPPYYGMRTYVPDQWLRSWFLGGEDTVSYGNENQLDHWSPQKFASELRQVWINTAKVCSKSATMVIRYGGIPDRSADPLSILKSSFDDSGWRIVTLREAGYSTIARRQADSFLKTWSKPRVEHDVWAKRLT